MQVATRRLWDQQNRHDGDRHRLFTAVARAIEAQRVLYPGSFVDVAPAFVWPEVIFNDQDRRAARFFNDVDGVAELIADHDGSAAVSFLPGDYADALQVEPESVDLLISLYAGLVSEHATDALRLGGWLLVNPSHGDAALASIDRRYELWGVVESRKGDYRVRTDGLDGYLIPKKPIDITPQLLRDQRRGIGYTKSPFAYLFQRVR